MRIVHTSDWHLGKTLEGCSRLPEQEMFIEEFVHMIEEKDPHMVIIAGDIYDTSNPPARAEALFYSAARRISKNGERAVLVIAGNHDSPDRLEAVMPLAREHGVIILGTPRSCAGCGEYGKFKVVDSGEGFVEISINGENAVVITVPYPSEKRLQELISNEDDEEKIQKSYSEKIGDVFSSLSEKYRQDTVNICVSHLFLLGGEPSDSERSIQLGGSYAVELSRLPKNAQYIAMGHLHKTQKFDLDGTPVVYSGSPLQYSKNERNNKNCVYLVDVAPGESAKVDKIPLTLYKPIEAWQCQNVEEALERCEKEKEKDIWVYMNIKTDRVILQDEMKKMKELRRDILQITPVIEGAEGDEEEFVDMTERKMEDVFRDFFLWEEGTEPTQEIVDMFLGIVNEGEEE